MSLRKRSRTLRRVVTLAALLVGIVFAAAGPASAHAVLVTATPATGSVVAAEPDHVTLTFSEPVDRSLSAVSILGPDGDRLDDGRLAAGPGGAGTLVVRLAPVSASGTFVVRWRVTAADDGHTTTGVLTFSVRVRSAVPVGATDGGGTTVAEVLRDVAEWGGFAGLALLAGILAVPEGPRRAAVLGWALVLVGALVQLFVYGVEVRGAPLGALFRRPLLSATLQSRQGHALLARIALLALAATASEALLRRAADRRPILALAPAVGLLLALAATWSATSHAATGPQPPLALAATTVHVAAMALWVGGLSMLAWLATWQRGGVGDGEAGAVGEPTGALPPGAAHPAVDLAAAASRFSALALASVATLAITGLYQAWRGLGSLDQLFTTGYGGLVFVKVLVLEIALAAAVRSRGLSAGTTSTALRRSVFAELLGVAVLLVISVLLVGSLPARK